MLQQIPTRAFVLEDRGVRFVVRVVEALERKRVDGIAQRQRGANPFLPYDEDMFVADISDTHVCLLNKYNVVEHHVLMVTREFEDQEEPLNAADFEAVWICLREFDGLAFYNADSVAGASQPHKHLQQVPLPFGAGSERTPIDPLLTRAVFKGSLGRVAEFPFVHALARVDRMSSLPVPDAAEATHALYLEMLDAVGRGPEPGPHNLLATRDWMLTVPRSVETFDSISVNALGFAGSLLVRDERELSLLRRKGPFAVLECVGVSRTA